MSRECRELFPGHHGLAIPTCITARAWRTCRDAWRDCLLAVSFEVGGSENVPGIPGACATRNFTYLVRGPWRPKSPASRLFTQPFIQVHIKENIKAPRHWPLWGEFTGDRWIPAQRANNAENVSIWWRHVWVWWRAVDSQLFILSLLSQKYSWIFYIKKSVHGSSKRTDCALDETSLLARSAFSFSIIFLLLGIQQNLLYFPLM